MSRPLDRILELQAIDVRIAELEKRQATFPERRAELSRDITALEEEGRRLALEIDRSRLDRRARENELEVQHERRQRYERQLNEVKTNVAYSALLTEIQNAKRTIDQLESEILALMERREENERRIAEIGPEVEVRRAAAAEELAILDREETEIAHGLEERRAERGGLIPEIDPNLLRLYERLRRANRFPALVPLRGQACGACHNRMPPQVVQEIIHAGAPRVCEACGVLVYAEPEAEPAEATG